MRPQTCAGRQARRQYYCGTCKTLGRSYGQRTRLLLNHDMVFLAEVLGALAGVPTPTTPALLEYAADATLILAKWKIADHIDDTGKRRWILARRVFRGPAEQASERLRARGLNLDALEQLLSEQSAREARAKSFEDVAEPTANATAEFFRQGAAVIGRRELAGALAALGRSFGYLVYLLDAYEDFERDRKDNAFNGLGSFGLSREWAAQHIRAMESEFVSQFALLPIPKGFLSEVETRLRANLALRLGERRLGRWEQAVAFGRHIRERENAHWLKGAAVLASVTLIAFCSPHWVRSAHSWRECLSLGVNLMAAGSVFAMVNLPDKPPSRWKNCWCVPDCDCSCCCDGCCDGCCDSVCDC